MAQQVKTPHMIGGGGMTAKPDLPTRTVGRPKVGLWLGAAVILLVGSWIVYELLTNPAFQWKVVAQYIFSPNILQGLFTTVYLTVLTMVFGGILGVILAIMRLSGNPVLMFSSTAFVWFFRSTPALVQLIFWFNLATLFPTISLGIPFGGPTWASWETNVLITPFIAALLGLGLNEAAYMAEIVRGGILSVDSGQKEAGTALGLTPLQTMRRIILPQAMRSIIPPTGNQVIGMLKYTSLASVVALSELLHAAQDIYNRTFQTIPLLIVASIWYLVLTTLLGFAQSRIEAHYSRGERTRPVTMTAALRRALLTKRLDKAATDGPAADNSGRSSK